MISKKLESAFLIRFIKKHDNAERDLKIAYTNKRRSTKN